MSDPIAAGAVTVIEGGTVIAFDGAAQRPLPDADLAFVGDRIVHVGGRYTGPAARRIDARGKLVLPGLISTHAHIGCHAGDRLLLDHGRRDFQRTGFLNLVPRLEGGPPLSEPESTQAACRYGLACLIKSGTTTVVEMGGHARDNAATLLEAAAESGIRLYYAPAFNGGSYKLDRDGHLHRRLDATAALDGLARAAAFIEQHDGAHAGRLRGLLVLDEFFGSTPELLRATRDTANRLRVGVTMHFAEQVYEFHDCVARNRRTPIQVLDECGLLAPDVILGHCLYVTGHRYAGRGGDADLVLLAAGGASVAHSPVAVARRGAMLESFRRYRAHGVRIALGTDSYPLDTIAEMRWACLLGRVIDRDPAAVSPADAFAAATLGGADALGRPDLGRLAAGMQADIVVVRADDSRLAAYDDPVSALVLGASAELVEQVFIAGRPVLDRGRLLAWPESDVLAAARASTSKVWEAFPRSHWTGRAAADLYPPGFATWHPT